MDLYEMLKNGISLEELGKNLHLFNTCSDIEVSKAMNDEEISYEHKEFLVDYCFDRINQLPKKLWLECMTFVTDKEIFIKYYIPKVETLSYEDLVFLVRNMCEPECGLSILNTAIFSRYLEIEKENNGTVLQSFLLSAKLYLYEIDDDKEFTLLNQIGEDIHFFVQGQEIYSEDVVSVIDEYVSTVLNYGKEMDINSPILQKSMDLVKNIMSKNILLSPSMLKMYTLYLVEQFNLDDYVQDVYISVEEKCSKTGSYQASAKRVTIYYDYILHVFNRSFQRLQITNQVLQDIECNYEYISVILHELGHVVEQKKVDPIYQSSSMDDSMKDPLFSSWFYNGELRVFNPELYELKHDSFICEVRADLFSIMHSSMQANNLLKGAFNENYLANISIYNAKRIVEFYTVKTEKGRKMLSPMRQFIDLYNQDMPENKHIQYIDKNDRSIMENMMLGFDVPIEIIRGINKIATGKIITTNLYAEIVRIIDDYNKNKQEEITNATSVHK